tara:strand:- start:1615 stop:1860 length:246 start_codon:yes stop_codon:yes gene_type:complete
MDSEPQEETRTVSEEIEKNKTLKMKLKGCERKLVLIQKEQRKIWRELGDSYEFLKKYCKHDWRRENYSYSPLVCSKCGVGE